ncbi:hypothetical protein N9S66_00735 [bacterium]|nr:hypothetical protein [bacterium]
MLQASPEIVLEPEEHRAENLEMIAEIFCSLDKDGSGKVEKCEFRKIFACENFEQLDDAAFSAALAEVNSPKRRAKPWQKRDKYGTTSMANPAEARFTVNTSLSSLMEDTMEYFFEELDADGDGTFDVAEFTDLVRMLADEEDMVLRDWLLDRVQDLRLEGE